jgi:putative redox protein
MVAINITYQGDLHCEAVHTPSGAVLATDAPKDNHGKGESFSPTDLVATALGTCIMTVMGIAARTLGVDLNGTTVSVEKEMVAKPVRRIGTLTVHIYFSTPIADEHQKKLEHAALTCPVHQSLNHDIAMPIVFHWA